MRLHFSTKALRLAMALPAEAFGAALKAVIDYAETGEAPALSGAAAEAFQLLREGARFPHLTQGEAAAIGQFLNTPLPPTWSRMSLAERRLYLDGLGGSASAGALRDRDFVSVAECWNEALRRDDEMPRAASYAIARTLDSLGWVPSGERPRLPLYGQQRVFRREQAAN